MIKSNSFITYVLIIAFAGSMTVFWNHKKSNNVSRKNKIQSSPDTFIPKGYSLVPIDIQNIDALKTLIGKHGVVDLFIAPKTKGQRPQLIAQQIKILRSPTKPYRFAALTLSEESGKLLQDNSSFFAIVQNPKYQSKKKIITKTIDKRTRKNRIYIESDG